MDQSLILALDIGTSSCRAALFDSAAQRFKESTTQREYPLITSTDGGAELDPLVVRDALAECIDETLRWLENDSQLRGGRVVAVGVSCFWHSLIGTDASGQPLTPIITWADSRCRPDAAALREELSEKKVHARTGCMLRASFWTAKLRWLQRTQKRLFNRVRWWMSPAEWLQQQFCGGAHCAFAMATGTGLLDPTKLQWDEEMLEITGASPEKLLPLTDDPHVVEGAAAQRFPQLAGARWFPAIGDGAASNLGSGAVKPGLAAINIGTSAALRIMRAGKKAQAPFGLFCYRVDRERYLVGGAVSNAGNLRTWCLRELRLDDEAELEEQLAARPVPQHGLTVLPFWTAERAPTWNEDAQGVIAGMTQATTAVDMLQAIMEASYYRLARIAELLIETADVPPKFLVSGGAQRSAVTMQRLANVMNMPLYMNPEAEASIRGAAVYALEKLGVDVPHPAPGKPVKPKGTIAAIYAAERKRQRTLENLAG